MNGHFRAMVRSTPSCVRICSSISRTIDPDVDNCERFVNNRQQEDRGEGQKESEFVLNSRFFLFLYTWVVYTAITNIPAV